MATAADIVTRAFRRLGIKAEDESLSADQAAHGLDVLNSMLSAWRLDAIDYTHAELEGADPFLLGAEYVADAVTLLADALAPDYSVQPPNGAMQAKARLQMGLAPRVPTVSVDAFLLRRSPLNGWRR